MLSEKRSDYALVNVTAAAALLLMSVPDPTLAQQQEQSSLPEAPPASTPAEIAKLPTEVKVEIEGVLRTCNSPVSVAGDLSAYRHESDLWLIVLHYEKIRCADLTAICRSKGCLHQVYASKDNQPYQLVFSAYISEIEIVRRGNALEIISGEGTRLLRSNELGPN